MAEKFRVLVADAHAVISAYVLKEEPLSELLLALQAIKRGTIFYSRPITEKIECAQPGLPDRDRLQKGFNRPLIPSPPAAKFYWTIPDDPV